MADIMKVKRNIGKMIDMGAPETDIDEYLKIEGVDIGELKKTPSPFSQAISETKRAGAAVTKGLVGDVPFVRKALPESIQQFEPYSTEEKALLGVSRLGRDIGLMKGIDKLGMARTALRGAGIGMATADTEELVEILKKSAVGAAVLPILNKGTEYLTPTISRIVRKGIKSTQQAWQDLIRAGFMVEKTTVEKIQKDGLKSFFTKSINPKLGTSNRSGDAFWKLGNKIFDSAMELRRTTGNQVQRWRNLIFRNPKIKVSVVNARNNFRGELMKPEIGTLLPDGNPAIPIQLGNDTANNRLLEINNLLTKTQDNTNPQYVYQIVDKLDDLIGASKKGVFSLGKNTGRIVANLRRDLVNQISKSAPRHIGKGLKAAEAKFSEIAEVTDDIFKKLPVRQEGVAQAERIGATEQSLRKGLKAGPTETTYEEMQVYKRLDEMLPDKDKFMELYKDVFAAQDLGREGVGMYFRRLLLAPRMAGFGAQVMQPITSGTGKVVGATGKAMEKLLPPYIMRRVIRDFGKAE